jgi:hypothetical protein
MDAVFISSIQTGFEDVRTAARRAVESLGLRPLMAETAGASVVSPQRALLDLVREADVFLLILGPRYSRPTEDEFEEAKRLSKEIVVLRQEGDCDVDQADFVERVSGGWTGGRLRGGFKDSSDVGFAAVQALSNRAARTRSRELVPGAHELARELAAPSHSGGISGVSVVRTVHVPLVGGVLLDALTLERQGLGDRFAALAREHGLAPQKIGIQARVSRDGIAIEQAGAYSPHALVEIHASGAVVCMTDVAGDDQFGSMRVEPSKLDEAIRGAGLFARTTWDLIDEREEVQQVTVVVAIPDAQHKVYGASKGGNSISMGSFGLPPTVVVPEPPTVVRRADVGGRQLTRKLVAEVRRVFVDAGAVDE